MSEYVTRAIVLGFRDSKEHDKVFDLYTESFGRIRVRAPGGRKIVSKLSPHLDVMNLATVKVVEKNALTLTDAILENNFQSLKSNPVSFGKALRALRALSFLSPEAVPDQTLWNFLLDSLGAGTMNPVEMVSVLGYDPRHASCELCGGKDVAFFDEGNQGFLCEPCSSKVKGNHLLYLER